MNNLPPRPLVRHTFDVSLAVTDNDLSSGASGSSRAPIEISSVSEHSLVHDLRWDQESSVSGTSSDYSSHQDQATIGMFNAGLAHHHRGELGAALNYYRQVLRCLASDPSRTLTVPVATLHQLMAHAFRGQDLLEHAADLYDKALEVGRKAHGSRFHPHVACILHEYADLLCEMFDFDGALELYQEELQVERAMWDPFHPSIAITLTNIAKIYQQQEEYADALSTYQEAILLQKTRWGEFHPDLATNLAAVASIHAAKDDHVRAIHLYLDALRIRRAVFGEMHLAVAETLHAIGAVMFQSDMGRSALRYFSSSLHIRQSLLGRDHRHVAEDLYNIATIFCEEGDEERAVLYFRETLRVERAVAPVSQTNTADDSAAEDVILTLQQIGRIHYQRGELDEALKYFQEALEVLQLNHQSNEANSEMLLDLISQTFTDIGKVHIIRGEARALVDAFANAMRCLMAAGKGIDHLAPLREIAIYGLSTVGAAAA